MGNSPSYIKNLLTPTTKPKQGRKAWSIDLETVWLPFLTATNVMGDTAIPHDALGAPLRLAYGKDGAVKFGSSGRPTIRIAKPLSDTIALIRENFTANLINFAQTTAKDNAPAYKRMVETARAQGEPIIAHDRAELDKALKLQMEQALKDAEAQPQPEAVKEPETTPPPDNKERELAGAKA